MSENLPDYDPQIDGLLDDAVENAEIEEAYRILHRLMEIEKLLDDAGSGLDEIGGWLDKHKDEGGGDDE